MNESKLIKAFTGMKEVTISIKAKYSTSFPGEIKKKLIKGEKSLQSTLITSLVYLRRRILEQWISNVQNMMQMKASQPLALKTVNDWILTGRLKI